MSSAAATHPGALAPSGPKQPTQAVARALKHYQLQGPALGPKTAEAWIAFLRPVANAATRTTHKAHVWADQFLLGVKPLLVATAAMRDEEGAEVFEALRTRWERMGAHQPDDLTVDQVLDWLSPKRNRSVAAAADCIRLVPPADVEIIGRVGVRSYQKRVFHAYWDASGRRQAIVLKEFLDEDAARAILRELQAYPLSMLHPNIIQTYRLENPLDPDRPFLAERLIHALDEEWDPGGIGEAALLLTDIARALAFLAEQNLVHGDIKPDNLGYDAGCYLLLDFGVARKREKFAALDSPTGTLSTRAPEVIRGKDRQTPKSDVYALAACIFFFLYGRYPLVAPEDSKGDPKTPGRDAYVAELKLRLEDGWEGALERLEDCKHRGLRNLLREMLDPNPQRRPAADEVLRRALKELPALIGTPVGSLFRASDELSQLERYLSERDEDMRLLPKRKAWDLEDRLDDLQAGLRSANVDELVASVKAKTDELLERGWPEPARTLLETARAELDIPPTPYGDLIARLRARIERRSNGWPAVSRDGLQALKELATSETIARDDVKYSAELGALIEVFEHDRSLVRQ